MEVSKIGNSMKPSREEILQANQAVHASLANSGEYNRSPHFREENQEKVKAILAGLVDGISKERVKSLDLGCGTGFIIHLLVGMVDEIHGVDITDDMMSQIDISSGTVFLKNSQAENTPYDDQSFSLVTAYSFLDHLESYEEVLREAFRVLEPGGIFYSDLNPNRHFSKLMLSLEDAPGVSMPEIVAREIKGMLHNGAYYEEKFGISEETLNSAEPVKSISHGFDPDEVIAVAREIGFSESRYEYDWYLGQAAVMHQQKSGDHEAIEAYLRMALPSTRGLFKYLRFVLEK